MEDTEGQRHENINALVSEYTEELLHLITNAILCRCLSLPGYKRCVRAIYISKDAISRGI